MIDINSFNQILNEICNELPDEFFKDLHLGIILSEELKISPHAKNNDLIILGEYISSQYGNQIIIYYGSFQEKFMNLNKEEIKIKIREVVRHEFRHHLENKANIHGKDSLEYEDLVQLQTYLRR